MNIIYLVIAFLFGCAVVGIACYFIFWEQFTDNGGTLLIDKTRGVYQFQLNNIDEIDDWDDLKYVIFKIEKASKPLKHIQEYNNMNLEDVNESK